MRWLLLIVAGCQELDAPRQLVRLDEPYFRCKVQPVLGKSCATFACHGDGQRYYRVFARNRLRLTGDESTRNSQLSADELRANYDAAVAYVDRDKLQESWLLLKPLEMTAGGYFHRGALIFKGGNVFETREDPDFKVLSQWVGGAQEDPACTEPGSDQ